MVSLSKVRFNWLDSYRIFPLNLDDLCKMFKVDGKVSKYKLEYNSIDMFKDHKLLEEFKISFSTQRLLFRESLLLILNVFEL
jgi:hypothetical protein